MSSPLYPYSSGDRLEDRNTYFYSRYHGAHFLDAWRADRIAALADLPAPREPVMALQATISKEGDGFDTAHLLAQLCTVTPDVAIGHAERLLQRFEVSKRLYRSYDAHFKAVQQSGYDALPLYVHFGVLCVRFAGAPGELPFLNALLKCVDTLVALQTRLGPAQRAELAWLIEREREWVERTAASVYVAIEREARS